MLTIRKFAVHDRDEWMPVETYQYTCDWCDAEGKQSEDPDFGDGWEVVVAGRGARRNMCPSCVPAEKS